MHGSHLATGAIKKSAAAEKNIGEKNECFERAQQTLKDIVF